MCERKSGQWRARRPCSMYNIIYVQWCLGFPTVKYVLSIRVVVATPNRKKLYTMFFVEIVVGIIMQRWFEYTRVYTCFFFFESSIKSKNKKKMTGKSAVNRIVSTVLYRIICIVYTYMLYGG
jgi:hypothetical protein